MDESVITVDSGYFCAGIIVSDNDEIIDAAPILKWAIGKDMKWLIGYCGRKGWKIYPTQEV